MFAKESLPFPRWYDPATDAVFDDGDTDGRIIFSDAGSGAATQQQMRFVILFYILRNVFLCGHAHGRPWTEGGSATWPTGQVHAF